MANGENLGTCDLSARFHENTPHPKIKTCVNWREQPAQGEPSRCPTCGIYDRGLKRLVVYEGVARRCRDSWHSAGDKPSDCEQAAQKLRGMLVAGGCMTFPDDYLRQWADQIIAEEMDAFSNQVLNKEAVRLEATARLIRTEKVCRNPNHSLTDGSDCEHEIGPSCISEPSSPPTTGARYRCGCLVEAGEFHDDEDHMEGLSCEPSAPVVAKGDGAVLSELSQSASSATPPTTRCPKCPSTKVSGLYCSTCGFRLDGSELGATAGTARESFAQIKQWGNLFVIALPKTTVCHFRTLKEAQDTVDAINRDAKAYVAERVRHLQEQLDDADAQNGRVADEVEKLRQELQISKTYGNTCDQQIINLSTVVQSEREARDKDTRIIRAYAEEVNMFIKEHKKLEAEVAQLRQELDDDEQMWRERCDAASKAGYEVAMEQEREARERVEGALREIVHSVGKLAEESGEDWRLKHAELMDAYEAGALAQVKSSESTK